MWFWLVGVAVGYPLLYAFRMREAKKRVHGLDPRMDSQFWYADSESLAYHETKCIHFPSMIFEHAFEGQDGKPDYHLYHVRRREDGVWERALTEVSARELAEAQAQAEEEEQVATPETFRAEGGAWEALTDDSIESAYRRYVEEHETSRRERKRRKKLAADNSELAADLSARSWMSLPLLHKRKRNVRPDAQ